MRLTTWGRYGLRLVLDIAQHEHDGPVSMTETSLRLLAGVELMFEKLRHRIRGWIG